MFSDAHYKYRFNKGMILFAKNVRFCIFCGTNTCSEKSWWTVKVVRLYFEYLYEMLRIKFLFIEVIHTYSREASYKKRYEQSYNSETYKNFQDDSIGNIYLYTKE